MNPDRRGRKRVMENGQIQNIITIGASAGGITAVSRLLATFHDDLNAVVFVVIHISRNSMTEVIINTLQKHSRLKCLVPQDNQQIENRTVYLAPADHHMLIEKGTIMIKKGAYENHWRPSIDVLFRSAAAAYDSCVTGIILTGLLDDGTSGMHAIKRSGGLSMVQDPEEADFPDMPNNVINTIDVDYKVSIDEMGYILSDLFSRRNCHPSDVPEDVKLEAEITRRMSSRLEDIFKLGELVPFSCPDCGGSLIKVTHDPLPRYRCYTGHTFTEKALAAEQVKGIEDSLWVAIRMMEERKNLLINMTAEKNDFARSERAGQIAIHVDRLKSMLLDLGKNS